MSSAERARNSVKSSLRMLFGEGEIVEWLDNCGNPRIAMAIRSAGAWSEEVFFCDAP